MSKVYDLTQIFNELDLLEIRLNILDPHVDMFVIGQSRQTFSGKEKPLYFNKADERWSKWAHKIIPVVVPNKDISDSFEMAAYQKDYLRGAIAYCNFDDRIYYGDIDEIWTPQTEEGKLKQLNYSYYLNNRSSEEWQGTNTCLFGNLRNLNELRADHNNILENGGWHFSNQGGADQIRKKLEAYDHQEMNTDENKQDLEFRMEHGIDYVGRRLDWQGKPFSMWLDESDWPLYLKENKEQWKHLLK